MVRRRTFAVVAVVFALVTGVAGCAERVTHERGKVLTTEELAGTLLEPGDLSGKWTVNTGPEGADLSTSGVITDANRDQLPQFEVCEKAGADSRAALNGLRWQAFRQVDRTVDDPLDPPKDREGHMEFVQQWLLSGDADELATLFDTIEPAFTECHGDIPAGEEGPGTVVEALIKPAGDQHVAALTRIEEAGGIGTWNIYTVFVRAGTVLMGLTVVDIVLGDLPTEIEIPDVDRIVEAAVDRF